MTWTKTDAFDEVMGRNCTPVYRFALAVTPQIALLSVIEFSAGSGDSLTVTGGAGSTITEGTDFNAVTSNAVTAQNIVTAWNTVTRIRSTGVRAQWLSGDFVYFVRVDSSGGGVGISTSDASAWDEDTRDQQIFPALVSHDGGYDDAHSQAPSQLGIVHSVKGLEWKLDPLTRKVLGAKGEVVVEDDGTVRRWKQLISLKNRRATLEIGAVGLADGDYFGLPTVFIRDVVPKGGRLVIKFSDAQSRWRDVQLSKLLYTAWHPAQIIDDVLQRAGADSNHYDASTLDPTFDTDRSHFVVSRYDDERFGLRNGILEPVRAGSIVDDLFALLHGTWRPKQSGPYEYVPFDLNAASVRTLDVGPDGDGHDVDELEQKEGIEKTVTRVNVAFATSEGKNRITHTERDDLAESESDAESEITITTDWVNSVATAWSGRVSAEPFGTNGNVEALDELVDTRYCGRQGYSGARYTKSGGGAALASGCAMGGGTGRYAVIGIGYPNKQQTLALRSDGLNETEAILVDAWTLQFDNVEDSENVRSGPSNAFIPFAHYLTAQITKDASSTVLPNGKTIGEWFGTGGTPGRGALGTNTPAFWRGVGIEVGIVDLTVPFYLARTIVERWARGCPVVQFATPLRHLDLEIGDVINFRGEDQVLGFMIDGSPLEVTWEITKKRIVLPPEGARVEFEATLLLDTSVNAQIPGTQWPTVEVTTAGVSVAVDPDKRIRVRVPGQTGQFDFVQTDDGEEVWHK